MNALATLLMVLFLALLIVGAWDKDAWLRRRFSMTHTPFLDTLILGGVALFLIHSLIESFK